MANPADPNQFQQAEEAFHRILDLKPEERAGELAVLEAANAALAAEVRSLLVVYERPPSLLKTKRRPVGEESEADLWVGRRVGAYRLLRKLGEGGMGVVYLAQRADDEYDSAVSIKLLRHALGGEKLESRFRRERQILAQLDHPHIARLHDGGTTADGVPYFVMEFIEGTALDQHCDQARLDLRGRLKLFLQVCSAVTYAHRRLIVHRDIKPANILVTADGLPKLLDFGIAKLLEEDGRDGEATLTEAGMRPLTPSYASPEQLRGEAITTASDIYSLGVTLYRLLTGRVPKRDSPAGDFPKASRSIEPDFLAEREGAGRTGGAWRKAMDGDLDVILLKVLALDADDRYSSVDSLAEDLRRWLEGRSILARPPTPLYRLRKFAGRNRLSTALVAILATVLLGYAATATYLVVRLSAEHERVQLEQQRSEQAANFLAKTFEIANPQSGRGAEITARQILSHGAERVGEELAEQPQLQARLFSTIAGLFDKLGLYAEALPLLKKSAELSAQQLGENHLTTLKTRSELGALQVETGDFESAEALLDETVRRLRQLGARAEPELASGLTRLGFTRIRRGDFAPARQAIEESLELHRRLPEPDPVKIGDALHLLGLIASNQGDEGRAEEFFRQAVASRAEVVGRLHPDQLASLKSLAKIAQSKNDFETSRSLGEEVLALEVELWGEEHPKIAFTLTNLGLDAMGSGDLERAESLFVRALEMRRKLLGAQHAAVSPSLSMLASLRVRQERLPEAEELYRESLRLARAAFGAKSPILSNILQPLGQLLIQTGRARDAEPLLRDAYELRREKMGPTNSLVVSTGGVLADCLSAQQHFAEAEPLMLAHYRQLEAQGDSSALAKAAAAVSELYARWPRAEKAYEFHRIAEAMEQRLAASASDRSSLR